MLEKATLSCLIDKGGKLMEYIGDIREEKDMEILMEHMIDEYGTSIWRMCYMYLKDKQLAEDAMQDTFIKVYEKYQTFQGSCSEKSWIMKIAINTCKNYLKTNWLKRVVVGIQKTEQKSPSLEECFLEKEEEREIFENIFNLRPRYKEVILLYYYQELKIKEIAEVLDISEANVSMRLQRGRAELRIKLGEEI